MNGIHKIVALAMMLFTAVVHVHVEEVEAHVLCPLLTRQECPLLK